MSTWVVLGLGLRVLAVVLVFQFDERLGWAALIFALSNPHNLVTNWLLREYEKEVTRRSVKNNFPHNPSEE